MKTKGTRTMIALASIFICWLTPSSICARIRCIDGIWYDVLTEDITPDSNCAIVLSPPSWADVGYEGTIDIPASFIFSGFDIRVIDIDEGAFSGNTRLTSVSIPGSISSISGAFSGCTGLTSVTISEGVTHIYGAFSGCTSLTSVTIPNSVTYIGSSAFEGCTSLTSVTIPNSVTTIGGNAFSGCTSLTSVQIPSSVTTIGEKAFENTVWYNNQPDGLIYINDVAYKYKGEMPEGTSMTIRNGTVSISAEAFCDCTGLTSVTIPSSVTSIDGAFSGCTSLASVTIPGSVTSFDSSFSGCTGLTSVKISDGVTSIGSCAFSGCTGLTSVTIPNSVTFIGGFAFEGCTGLTSVTIPNIVTSIDVGAFEGCSRLTSVTIPNSVTSIGEMAFMGCTGLTSVTIPSSVTYIGRSAFAGCSLTSVTIPNSVTYIDDSAFACSNLLSIYVEGETPASILPDVIEEEYWGNGMGTFQSVDKNACVLYVPKGCKSAYENAEGWKDFQNIKELYPRVMVVEEATGAWCGYCVRGLVGMAYMRENYPDTFLGIGVHNGDEYVVSAYDNWMGRDTGIEGYPSAVINRTKIIDPNSAELEQNLNNMDPSSIFNMKLVATTNNDGMVRFLVELSSLASYTDVLYDMAFVILEDKLPINQSNLYSGGSYGPMGGFEDLPRNCNIEIDDVARAIYPSAKGSSEFVPSQIIRDEVYNIEYEAPLPNIVNVNNVWAAVLLIDHNTGEIVQATKTNTILFQEEPSTDISTLDNAIYVEQTDGRIGGTMDIPVKLKNSYPVRGFQFNLELPEGTTINGWELSTSRMPEGATLSDMIATKKIDGNKIQVACSLNYGNATFTGNDGEIATVNVTFSEGMEEGTYPIYLTACDLTTAGGIDEDLSDVTSTLVLEDYIVGDANGDGKIRIGDATTILNYIVGTASDNFNEKAADANGDGKIRIGDATTILNIIVNQ